MKENSLILLIWVIFCGILVLALPKFWWVFFLMFFLGTVAILEA